MIDSAVSAVNQLLEFWVNSHWLVALLMAIAVNIIIYVGTAWCLSQFINAVVQHKKAGAYIDNRQLKKGQIKTELKNGITACVIFAVCSLATRELYTTLWPVSIAQAVVQIICFALFYETYSYFVHRLLHTKTLVRVHLVHHRSVRVTPWSAYSVHPVEALFIGISAPLFMLMFPLSLGTATVFHVAGMMFTILLHSNFKYQANNIIMKLVFTYPAFHSAHHVHGNVNYGFVNQWWDKLFRTIKLNDTKA